MAGRVDFEDRRDFGMTSEVEWVEWKDYVEWTMSYAIAGSILNLFAAICVGCSGELPAAWGILMLVPAAISVGGAAWASAGARRKGAYLVMAGSIFTIPVGLVGLFGGWRLLQEETSSNASAQQPEP